MKLIIDGELKATNETGTEVIATTNDLFYIQKRSAITFAALDYGVALPAISGARMRLDE